MIDLVRSGQPVEISSPDDVPPAVLGGVTLFVVDALREAQELLGERIEQLRAKGWRGPLARLLTTRAVVDHASGDLAEAELHAREGLELVLPGAWGADNESLRQYAAAALALPLIDRGMAGEALATIGPETPHSGLPKPQAGLILTARGAAKLALGQVTEALTDAEAGYAIFEQLGWHAGPPARRLLAAASAANGDAARAIELLDIDIAASERSGARLQLATSLTLRALMLGGSEQLEMLERAVASAEVHPGSMAHTTALIEYGAAVRRSGKPAESKPHLQAGLEAAQRSGAVNLEARARSELDLAGVKASDRLLKGADALTAAERRVCAMAADGMSNPEIAQRLFVSRRTVETHLTHSYATLGISSRKELPKVMAAVPA